MKVLFIGEGNHDIGPSAEAFQPRAARGTIPTLTRRVCPNIAHDSVALAWREIHRFNPAAKKSGYGHKIVAASLIAEKKFGCAGLVAVADRDRDSDRKAALDDGQERARKSFPKLRLAWGLAVESVEAWTLAVPDKIAEVLGEDVQSVQQLYPNSVAVEELWEKSGKKELRSKRLLKEIAKLKKQKDSTEFRQAVVEITDVKALEKKCPLGFAPFAEQIRREFAGPLDG